MAEGLGGAGHRRASSDNQISHNQIDVEECLGSWLTYLQMLNGLCSAGTRLALSLQTLVSVHDTMAQCRVTTQCLAGWEELTRATNVASHTVKKHVDAAMKDYEILDNDGEKHDILRDNLLTFINLQYQFCVACCKCLGSMAECSCSQDGSECDIVALQQCFERLYSSPPPPTQQQQHQQQQQQQQSSHRSPLPYSLFPLQVQRRWSETAAAEMSGCSGSESGDQTLRRWSMPWDCRHVSEWPRQVQEGRTRLKVPMPLQMSQQNQASNSSRSTTPDSLWNSGGGGTKPQQHHHHHYHHHHFHNQPQSQQQQQSPYNLQQQQNQQHQQQQQNASQDGLREAIQLLSCKPGIRVSSTGHHQQILVTQHQTAPGLTLTTYDAGYEVSSGGGSCWPDSRPIGSSLRNCWPTHHHDHSHSSDHSRDSDHSHRDSEHSGGSGSAHGDSKDSIHSHHSDYSCHRESDPGVIDLLSSRKNSSSTDSCISVHSRSGSESAAGAGESVRSNLYSMWSGNDLPFIKLPESTEAQDDSII